MVYKQTRIRWIEWYKRNSESQSEDQPEYWLAKFFLNWHLVDFATPMPYRVKIKGIEKIDEYLDLARELKDCGTCEFCKKSEKSNGELRKLAVTRSRVKPSNEAKTLKVLYNN